jgi:hypothetical protein
VTDHSLGISAHAKINLFLRVLAQEDTGFHSVETLLCLLDLKDDLVVTPDPAPGEVTLEVIGADLGPPEENLAFRAAKMVLAATGNRLGVGIRLTKRIPVAAGLGGGSSDAAAALVAVNAVVGNAVPQNELLQFAARLGSDVPFFLIRCRSLFRPRMPTPGWTSLVARPAGEARLPSPSARSRPGAILLAWLATTSSRLCSGVIPRSARGSRHWPERIRGPAASAGLGQRSSASIEASGIATRPA